MDFQQLLILYIFACCSEAMKRPRHCSPSSHRSDTTLELGAEETSSGFANFTCSSETDLGFFGASCQGGAAGLFDEVNSPEPAVPKQSMVAKNDLEVGCCVFPSFICSLFVHSTAPCFLDVKSDCKVFFRESTVIKNCIKTCYQKLLH